MEPGNYSKITYHITTLPPPACNLLSAVCVCVCAVMVNVPLPRNRKYPPCKNFLLHYFL